MSAPPASARGPTGSNSAPSGRPGTTIPDRTRSERAMEGKVGLALPAPQMQHEGTVLGPARRPGPMWQIA
eukprot:scaffold9726_cov119-Isochrysis_galbana.AAC.2